MIRYIVTPFENERGNSLRIRCGVVLLDRGRSALYVLAQHLSAFVRRVASCPRLANSGFGSMEWGVWLLVDYWGFTAMQEGDAPILFVKIFGE